MSFASEFQTLAEVGITLAGFTGIAVAFFIHSSTELVPESKARIVAVLSCGLSVVIFAFLPRLLGSVIGDESIGWRAAQCVFCLYHFSSFYLHRALGDSVLPTHSALESFVLFPIAFSVATLQAATSVGFLFAYIEEVYFLALIWFVFAGAWNFAMLIWRNLVNAA